MQPLNHDYLPNLAKNIWPSLQSPFYDLGARYTVPYVVWSDGIGWRNDKIKTDIAKMTNPWNIFWESPQLKGKVGMLDDYRDGLSHADAARRDHGGRRPRSEHRGPGDHREGRQRPAAADGRAQHQDRDHRLPDAAGGQDVAAPVVVGRSARRRLLLHAEGRLAGRARPTGRPTPTASCRTTSCSCRATRTSRRSRTTSSTSCSTRPNAYDNFIEFVGYTPPQNAIDADVLIRKKLIPESLRGALVRPDQFSANQELLVADDRRAIGSGRTPGRSSRPADARRAGSGAALALPGVVWLSVFFVVAPTRCCDRVRPGHARRSRCRHWNPLDWNVGYLVETLRSFWPGGSYWPSPATRSSTSRAAGAVLRDRLPGRLLRRAPRRPRRGARAARLILPFWVSYLLRMLAWIGLLVVRRLAPSAAQVGSTR